MEMEFLEKILTNNLKNAYIKWDSQKIISPEFKSLENYQKHLNKLGLNKTDYSILEIKMISFYKTLFKGEFENQ
jgi:hypothetical protein